MNYVGPEHLLLGLVREPKNDAAEVLERLGVPIKELRTAVERELSNEPKQIEDVKGLTPAVKRVIEFAYDESKRLTQNFIGTEHLLLGLIRQTDSIAAKALGNFGVDLEKTREMLRELTGAGALKEESPWIPEKLNPCSVAFLRIRQEIAIPEILFLISTADNHGKAFEALTEALDVRRFEAVIGDGIMTKTVRNCNSSLDEILSMADTIAYRSDAKPSSVQIAGTLFELKAEPVVSGLEARGVNVDSLTA